MGIGTKLFLHKERKEKETHIKIKSRHFMPISEGVKAALRQAGTVAFLARKIHGFYVKSYIIGG